MAANISELMFRQSEMAQYVHQGIVFVLKLVYHPSKLPYYFNEGKEFVAPWVKKAIKYALRNFAGIALLEDLSWKRFDCLEARGCRNLTDNQTVLALAASSTNDTATKLITVVNVTISELLECPVETLAKTERDHCPENAISADGQQWMHISMLIFICALVLGASLTYQIDRCGRRFLFWTALFLFWAADCSAGLWSGMTAQMIIAPTGVQTWSAILMDPLGSPWFWALVWNVIIFDLPMWVVKFLSNYLICLPEGLRNLVYIIFITAFGIFFSREAIGWASRPATIVVFGHSSLLVGVQTFFLQFPKRIFMNYIMLCITEHPFIRSLGLFDSYKFVTTERKWLWEHLAQPLPRAIVCVMEEEEVGALALVPVDDPGLDLVAPDPPPDPVPRKKMTPAVCFLLVCFLLVVSPLVTVLFCGVLWRAPTCLPKQGQVDGCERFYATFRDFNSSHPDFENPANAAVHSVSKGLVEKKLGKDGKPVYIGGRTLSSQGNYNEWWNTVPGKNKEERMTLDMTRTAAGTLVMDWPNFFPLDGKGLGDEVFGHNYFFTMVMRFTFVYNGGERFTFKGDDDCWVFINEQLALDLGGTHTQLEGTIDLDKLGLTQGRRASLDLFYAERHTRQSSLRIETTVDLEQANCCLVGLTRIAKYLMKHCEDMLAYVLGGVVLTQ